MERPAPPGAPDLDEGRAADDPLRTVRLLRRSWIYLSETVRTVTAPEGLSPIDYLALYYVDRADGLHPSTLSRTLGVRPPAVSEILDRLEARQCLARTREEPDRRTVTVRIRPAGHALVEQLSERIASSLARLFERLSPSIRSVLGPGLQEFVAMLRQQAAIDGLPDVVQWADEP